jgi:Sigma-70, region 4
MAGKDHIGRSVRRRWTAWVHQVTRWIRNGGAGRPWAGDPERLPLPATSEVLYDDGWIRVHSPSIASGGWCQLEILRVRWVEEAKAKAAAAERAAREAAEHTAPQPVVSPRVPSTWALAHRVVDVRPSQVRGGDGGWVCAADVVGRTCRCGAHHRLRSHGPLVANEHEGGRRVVGVAPAGDAETRDDALPAEFLRLQDLLGRFAAALRRVLDDRERRLLELRWGLDAPTDGPELTLRQVAAELGVSFTRVVAQEQELLRRTVRRRLWRAGQGELAAAVREAAEAWSGRLGDPGTTAVLGAWEAAGGPRRLLWLASVALGGLNPLSGLDTSQGRFERVAGRLLARRGPLPAEELGRAVVAVLPPEDVGERLDAALRARLLAPAVRRVDGRLALPELAPAARPYERSRQRVECRDRRLQALIGALEERGPATVPQLLQALETRLPAGDLPSADGARWLLRRHPEAFRCVARGRYALVDGAAQALLLA